MPSSMAGDRHAHPNVCMCLVLHAFLAQASAFMLQNNADEQDEVRGGNLAVCISGGIRQGDECAESHVRSIVEASRNNFNHVKIFFATWTDRQCVDGDTGPVNESFVRNMYPNQDMDVWIGDARGYPINEANAYPEPNEEDKLTKWPYKFSYGMWQKARNMATLWEKCMDMIPDTYDVIVRIRPDLCLPDSYRLTLSPGSAKIVRPAVTDDFFIANLEEGKVFMARNNHHSKDTPDTPDDRMGFGLAKPMKQVFGTLKQRADQHDFDITDEQYVQKWGTPEWSGSANVPLNPHGFWVREPYPEILVAHQLQNMNINVTFTLPENISLWSVKNRGVHCGAGHQTRRKFDDTNDYDDYDYT